MAKRKKSGRKRSWAGCGCPSGSVRLSTKGRGRGWVCMSKTPKVRKRHGLTFTFHPFVKARCS